jgi:hypothetical protein
MGKYTFTKINKILESSKNYDAFLKKAMKKFKIKDLGKMSDKETAKFFKWVDDNWDAKNEETEDDSDVDEGLSIQARMKMSRSMKKNSKKIAHKRQISMKKKASLDTIKKRAEKSALKVVKKKLLRGKDDKDLSFAARDALGDKLKKKKALIKKIAKKLIPHVKKKEKARLAKKK